MWEFRVRTGQAKAFERAYSAQGTWAQLFERDAHFRGTELLRDSDRYITIDRWDSEPDYRAFLAAFRDEYEALDRSFESLTDSERLLGAFTVVD